MRDLVPDEFSDTPEERAEASALADALHGALEHLSDREALVLRLRMGSADGRERTLEEVGLRLGIKQARVRQIENKALRKLKYHESRNRRLRDAMD